MRVSYNRNVSLALDANLALFQTQSLQASSGHVCVEMQSSEARVEVKTRYTTRARVLALKTRSYSACI